MAAMRSTYQYLSTAAALLNNIGTSYHRQNEAENAMNAYSESIRMHKMHHEMKIGTLRDYLPSKGRMQAHIDELREKDAIQLSKCQGSSTLHNNGNNGIEALQGYMQQSALNIYLEPVRISQQRNDCSPSKSCFDVKRHQQDFTRDAYVSQDAASTLFNISLLHLSTSNIKRAQESLELALDMLPPSHLSPPLAILEIILCNNLGCLAYEQENLEDALECFLSASSKALHLTKHWNTLLNCSDGSKKTGVSPILAEQAHRHTRVAIAVLLNVARAYGASDLQEKSIDACLSAKGLFEALQEEGSVEDRPSLDDSNNYAFCSSTVTLDMACIYYRLGETQAAHRLFQASYSHALTRYGPNHPATSRALQGLLALYSNCATEVCILKSQGHAAAA